MRGVLTVTLNPAVDMATAVPQLLPGRKLRCETPRIDPGGGGINVSRMIKELGGTSTALVAIGGANGELLRDLLTQAGIEAVFLRAVGMTRQSFSVTDRSSGGQFRFVLPGPAQDAAFAESVLKALSKLLSDGKYAYVVASGSLPPGLAEDIYGGIAEMVRGVDARLILDTAGSALQAALGRGVYLVRSNRLEAQALAGALDIPGSDVAAMARSLVAGGAAEAMIVTLGAEGALLAYGGDVVRISAPRVEVVSAIGAGDSFVGALSFALSEGWLLPRACAYGVAAAAAAVTTEATELAHKEATDRLFATIQVPVPTRFPR